VSRDVQLPVQKIGPVDGLGAIDVLAVEHVTGVKRLAVVLARALGDADGVRASRRLVVRVSQSASNSRS